ncbi:MAG: hypothetical protein K6E87_00925 [bacterium]|nr:hypothetical protein [bacterium]
MKKFKDYDVHYPNLVVEILKYFNVSPDIANKNVMKFCEFYKNKFSLGNILDPDTIFDICNILVEKGNLTRISFGNMMGFDARYICFLKSDIDSFQFHLNAIVYGFEYIYNYYKENDIVVPIVCKSGEDYSVGTAFKLLGGIVTARHCIENQTSICIKGYSSSELNEYFVFFHVNPAIDIAYIVTNRPDDSKILIENGKITQDIMVMGYPKYPTFTQFLTAEKATISSKAESIITPTKGSVAAFGKSIFAKTELMLITAKIVGGNGGGLLLAKMVRL